MARTWYSITVELLGGRGEELWPRPGRIFAVGPSHTFRDLADAINTAFARWDFAHLSQFTRTDGSIITDNDEELDNIASGLDPVVRVHDLDITKVMKTVELGETFKYLFDFGDNWVHECEVAEHKIDPVEELGIRPKTPLPYWGGGTMPDQYGRDWLYDDGEGDIPPAPKRIHPMRSWVWPFDEQLPRVDLQQLRAAIESQDTERFIDSIIGKDIDADLTDVLEGVPLLFEDRTDFNEAIIIAFASKLRDRGTPEDLAHSESLWNGVRAVK